MTYIATYKVCDTCAQEYGYNGYEYRVDAPACPYCKQASIPVPQLRIRVRNAQVSEKEATAVAIHPETGEVVYCFDRPDREMPEKYRQEGFVKKQFHSIHELRKFCKERGVVNDVEYDNQHDGYFEEMQAVQKEREREREEKFAAYRRERERVAREIDREQRNRRK